MPVWPCAVGAKRQAVLAMKRKSAGERVSVHIESNQRKGETGCYRSPLQRCGLKASARVLRLLEVPPVLTLLHIVKERVLESQVLLQMLITC